MSKELELKSGTTKKAFVVKLVRVKDDVQFFGVNGSQVAEGQGGIHLELQDDGRVIVTCDSFPKEQKILYPANISYVALVSNE